MTAEASKPAPLMVLAALGVVYGDLGTSPLYTIKVVAALTGGTMTQAAALGSLSLILWTLTITLSIKYCIFVLRADNHGEGGILALMSLIGANRINGGRWLLTAIGLLGAGLLYGDGAITPAISVLSALEGVNVATTALAPYVLPAAVVILAGLFLAQHFGTARIGLVFGPMMLIWFLVIAGLGVVNLIAHPQALAAINPLYGFCFLKEEGWRAFAVLGGVFLCVTGGEAMYADIGHFGKSPVRIAWYVLVFPALILNYAGQVGNILASHRADNPFFQMGPGWAVYPLVAMATIATIIASQAIITGAYSLTRQAIQLGWLPGMAIRQTSGARYGEIYVPLVNWLMMAGTIALTLIFRDSTRLAGAYGMAVAGTMLATTVLLVHVCRRCWGWSWASTVPPLTLFFAIDIAYFAANLIKLPQGGWIPLTVAILLFGVMALWRVGTEATHRRTPTGSYTKFLALLRHDHIPRVPGVAVFLTRVQKAVPALLTQHVQHMGALQETVIALSIRFVERPRVAAHDRATAQHIGDGLWRVTLRYGFMERTEILTCLQKIETLKQLDFNKVIYFGARDLVCPDPRDGWFRTLWVRLFGFLFRNTVRTMDRFHIPAQNFVEIAREVRI
jgi:KUP system potassium uptake protein